MTDNVEPDNVASLTEAPAYECQACGWIYDHQQEEASVPFSKLPDSFSCPLCGVDKSEFKKIDTASLQMEGAVNREATTASHIVEDANIVIIGAGLAGWGVVDAIRAKDKDINIILITADNGDRYHKPMLSAAFSQNKSSADLIRFTGEDASKTANIHLLAQTQVHRIDSEKHIVETNKGDIHYGDLVIAMGATPAMPPSIANLSEDNIWHLNDITKFAKVQKTLANQSKHIAVIGAGMVGTEIAEDLTKAGHKVTLLDMNEAPLALMLPPMATAKIKVALETQGIEFLGGSRVTNVMATQVSDKSDKGGESTREAGFTLHFVEGNNHKKTLDVDHILVSTGLKVDGVLPLSAGIDFDVRTGIQVDEASLQTSQPNIYAIGDCMSIGGIACRYVAPLRTQAATIAEHILGNKTDNYEHQAYQHKPPMIRLKNKSISVTATGTPTADTAHGEWKIVSEKQMDTHNEMVLQQISDNGEVVATVTLKTPI